MTTPCISCGMPMNTAQDHASGDVAKHYCCHCARQDGSMKTYEQAQNSMIAYMVRTQGIDQGKAQTAVEALMRQLPAWRTSSD